ncbi:MAG: hypothetical protein HC837_20845, partial [Chloroflexaceae bacterium]|nr:hypothetical protein [Chloroflexaceae bacterium]
MMVIQTTSADMTATGPQITPRQFNAELLQHKHRCLGFLMDVASDPNDKRRVQASSIICRMSYLNEDGSDSKRNTIPTLLDVSVDNAQTQTPIEPMFTTMGAHEPIAQVTATPAAPDAQPTPSAEASASSALPAPLDDADQASSEPLPLAPTDAPIAPLDMPDPALPLDDLRQPVLADPLPFFAAEIGHHNFRAGGGDVEGREGGRRAIENYC